MDPRTEEMRKAARELFAGDKFDLFIGIAAKGCDLRSIVALVKERQVQRDGLVVVGVPCRGMIDRRKVESAAAPAAAASAAAATWGPSTCAWTARCSASRSW